MSFKFVSQWKPELQSLSPGLSLGKLLGRREPCQKTLSSWPSCHVQGHLLILKAWHEKRALEEYSRKLSAFLPSATTKATRKPVGTWKHKQVKRHLAFPPNMGMGSRWVLWANHHVVECILPWRDRKVGFPAQAELSYMDFKLSIIQHSVSSSVKWKQTKLVLLCLTHG